MQLFGKMALFSEIGKLSKLFDKILRGHEQANGFHTSLNKFANFCGESYTTLHKFLRGNIRFLTKFLADKIPL
jgi:hypothetical protein